MKCMAPEISPLERLVDHPEQLLTRSNRLTGLVQDRVYPAKSDAIMQEVTASQVGLMCADRGQQQTLLTTARATGASGA